MAETISRVVRRIGDDDPPNTLRGWTRVARNAGLVTGFVGVLLAVAAIAKQLDEHVAPSATAALFIGGAVTWISGSFVAALAASHWRLKGAVKRFPRILFWQVVGFGLATLAGWLLSQGGSQGGGGGGSSGGPVAPPKPSRQSFASRLAATLDYSAVMGSGSTQIARAPAIGLRSAATVTSITEIGKPDPNRALTIIVSQRLGNVARIARFIRKRCTPVPGLGDEAGWLSTKHARYVGTSLIVRIDDTAINLHLRSDQPVSEAMRAGLGDLAQQLITRLMTPLDRPSSTP